MCAGSGSSMKGPAPVKLKEEFPREGVVVVAACTGEGCGNQSSIRVVSHGDRAARRLDQFGGRLMRP